MPAPNDPGAPAGGTGTDVLERIETVTDKGWNVLLWNDPVNTMDYVSAVLVRVLQISAEQAQELMWAAHTESKAAVFHGQREEAETIMVKLHAALLQATMEAA